MFVSVVGMGAFIRACLPFYVSYMTFQEHYLRMCVLNSVNWLLWPSRKMQVCPHHACGSVLEFSFSLGGGQGVPTIALNLL